MPPLNAATWPGLAAMIPSITGSSSEASLTVSSARYGVGSEPVVPGLGDRLVERGPGDPLARLDELRELRRIDRVHVDSGADEVVGDHVRRRQAVGACRDRRLVERDRARR